MLKRLFLIWIFSGSLDSFSQDTTKLDLSKLGPAVTTTGTPYSIAYMHDFGQPCRCSQCLAKMKPDTLRAICLVTLFPNGIAHARMGFVVIEQGKEVRYLDCRKRALKLPQVGWGYRLINPNDNGR